MQYFIVISDPYPVVQEAMQINRLFAEGMPLFHLRKPGYSETALWELLEQIDPQYHDRIALHQHHQLAAKSGIKRLHFPEVSRAQLSGTMPEEVLASGFILSTSIHSSTTYQQLPAAFAYTFLGPFAPSISKPGYGEKACPEISGIEKQNTRIIALGGLHSDNVLQARAAGYDGVAVLGSIWKDENVTGNFNQLQKIWHTADHPY